jgi:DNA-binding transcriptional regulator YhcF (GntR family)
VNRLGAGYRAAASTFESRQSLIEAGKPIFVQIAEQIERDIIDGVIEEESPVPSTNEFAAFHRINPATAGKGVNRLVNDGILYKRRGIGMFVAIGARQRLIGTRTEQFRTNFVGPLLAEAVKLGITPEQLSSMISSSEPGIEPSTERRANNS